MFHKILTDGLVKKVWHIYTMEYYSAVERNKIGSCAVM